MTVPPDDPQPPPLGYRNPADEPRMLRPVLALVGGFACGLLAPAATGFLLFIGRDPPLFGAGASRYRYWPETLVFGTAAVASLVVGVLLLVRRSRRLFLVGLLLGALVMCSVEGTCFFNPQ